MTLLATPRITHYPFCFYWESFTRITAQHSASPSIYTYHRKFFCSVKTCSKWGEPDVQSPGRPCDNIHILCNELPAVLRPQSQSSWHCTDRFSSPQKKCLNFLPLQLTSKRSIGLHDVGYITYVCLNPIHNTGKMQVL